MFFIDEYLERWRPVREFEGFYEVSDHGRVRSLSRIVSTGTGTRIVDGKILRQAIKAGYPSVCLCNSASQVDKHVHRLVAMSFVAGMGQVVRHLDGDRMNSNYKNLAWGSYKDNEADKRDHGRMVEGIKHHAAILTDDLVRKIRQLHKDGYSQLAIAEATGIGRGSVGYVVRGQSWKHVI